MSKILRENVYEGNRRPFQQLAVRIKRYNAYALTHKRTHARTHTHTALNIIM